MEKSGRLQLTTEEFVQCSQQKVVPDRIKNSWGLKNYQEVKEFLDSGDFEVVDVRNEEN